MGILSPDSADYPDYRANPNAVFEAVGTLAAAIHLGLPPLFVTAMVMVLLFDEKPHTHVDIADPTPQAVTMVVESTTSAPPSPFIPFDDSANMRAILARYQAQRHTINVAISASQSSMNAALFQ